MMTPVASEARAGQIPTCAFDWKLTWYRDSNEPNAGSSGRSGSFLDAQKAANKELEDLPLGIEAFASVVKIQLAHPDAPVHLARGERSVTGEIVWYDIVPE